MKSFVNLRLIFFIAISLCLGIGFYGAIALFSSLSGVLVAISFVMLCSAFIILFIKKLGTKRTLSFIGVFIIFFTLGSFLVGGQITSFENANLNSHYYQITARIDQISSTIDGEKLLLTDVNVKGNIDENLDYKISLYVEGKTYLDIGDKIYFSSKLKDKSTIYSDRVMVEDISDKVKYTANITADQIMLVHQEKTIFQHVNVFIRDSLKEGLEDNEFSIAYALLLGNDDYMDEQVLSSYRAAGVAHIFAVSGLHIGFLSMALNFVLKKCGVKTWIKAIVIIPVLFFYSGVCGFSASSIRAAIMATVMLLVSIKGERYDGLSSLSIAAIILLLINPMEMFRVGFILSFGVVLGIVVLSEPISRLLKFMPEKIASTFGTVLSAQIVGMPICLMFFGKFSVVAIIANVLFIPIVSAIFIALLFMALFGGIFGISFITLFVPNYVIKALNFLITAVDTEALMVGGFSLFGFVIFYYLAVIICSGLINLRFITKLVTSILCIVICIIGTIICNVKENNSTKLFVTGSQNVCASILSEGQTNTLIINSINPNLYSSSKLNALANKSGVKSLDAVIFCGDNYDYHAVITKINNIFDIKNVYYYGDKEELTEKVITKSFPGIRITNLYSNQSIEVGKWTIDYFTNGDGAMLSRNDQDLLFLTETDRLNIDKLTFNQVYEKVIAIDSIEWLDSLLSKGKMISYRSNAYFDDAESQGIVVLRLG